MHRLIPYALAALLSATLFSAVTASASDRSGDDRSSSRSQSSRGDAGTVKSYADGVLTISVAGGGELSGKVARRTDISCDDDPSARSSRQGGDDPSGDDKGGRREDDSRSDDSGSRREGESRSDDRRGRGRGRDDDCGDDALKAGAAVHKAELRVSSRGLVWDEVELAS